ncbi:MFS general substrate transporter [Aspergillus japonicus CBS 114.51]|uniref:MFS general substrate transporter n=1 Tax=Aspergillus japonicus CBS 114.51 TaxID=1448312 RepID=A0A8T8X0I0_ASPJA|nr:MFS general substrate transporter [Aspergillus japonicus CBS 114.51]RAH81410.1 MFS general substrate transporter [Aspergillus japonicus CBS 114.51]
MVCDLDNFLFTFITPILPEILETRLQQPASRIQTLTSLILAMNALVSIILAPVTGYLADKLSSRNGLLIAAWVANMLGTAVTAWATTLTVLIIGRLIQTVAGSVIWIVGMAMLANAAGTRHLSKAFGVAVLLVSAGLLTGPAVSAALYKFVSYPVMWSSAFIVLLIGLILQLLVLEPRGGGAHVSSHPKDWDTGDEEHDTTRTRSRETQTQTLDATDPLLPSSPAAEARTYHTTTDATQPPSPAASSITQEENIYWLILRKKRVAAGLLGDTLLAIVIASFEATIPLHIREVFHWDSFHAGLLFLLLQAPTLVLVVPVGGLKDRFGLRYPVSLGFVLLAPSLVLLGLPGQEFWGMMMGGHSGRVVYLGALVAIGVWRTLILGYGGVEVLNGANELADEKPGIFGSNGGYSRTFSLSNATWKGGMFIGPLVSGALTEAVGYFYMNLFLGMTIIFRAWTRIPCAPRPTRTSAAWSGIIVLAGGTGGFGRYLAEAITSSPDYAVAILTRSKAPIWTSHPKITTHQTDYTAASLLPILNTTRATTLLSLIRCSNDIYLPLHTHLLDACIASQTCKRLIPSEWAGNVDDFPLLPRSYGLTRAPFREILRARAASHHIEWTLVNHGWYMDYFLAEHKSYIAYVPGEFPIDPQTWTYRVEGDGEAPHITVRVPGVTLRVCTVCRKELRGLHEVAGRPFKREYRSVEQIEHDVEQHPTPSDDPNIALPELEECTIKGAICCPREKALRQKEEIFAGMEFVGLEELLVRAEREGFN